MKDYFLIDDRGKQTAIANLPTYVIRDLLLNGVEMIADVTEAQFIERLKIELVARSIS